MSERLDAIRERAEKAHGCTSDPCGSPVCLAQRDRTYLLAEVERLEREVTVLRAMKVQPIPPAPTRFDVRTNQTDTTAARD